MDEREEELVERLVVAFERIADALTARQEEWTPEAREYTGPVDRAGRPMLDEYGDPIPVEERGDPQI